MPKYKIYGTTTSFWHIEVEADSQEEAADCVYSSWQDHVTDDDVNIVEFKEITDK